MADRLRVVSNTDQNLRLNPDTGAVGGHRRWRDGPLNPAGQSVVGSAYTNPKADAQDTPAVRHRHHRADKLVEQNPPNAGTLTDVGSGLGVESETNSIGYDIVPAFNQGFCVDQPHRGPTETPSTRSTPSAPPNRGTAVKVGDFAFPGRSVQGLAALPDDLVGLASDTAATFESGGSVDGFARANAIDRPTPRCR